MENQTNQPNQPNQSNQANKNKGDLPGTSRDPTGRVIGDKGSQGKDRQDQGSDRSDSGYRSPEDDSRNRRS